MQRLTPVPVCSGVERLEEVPAYTEIYPRIFSIGELLSNTARGGLDPENRQKLMDFEKEASAVLLVELDGFEHAFPLKPVTSQLLGDKLTTVFRNRVTGGGQLNIVHNPAETFGIYVYKICIEIILCKI